ncbi:MAG: hypothetical protein ACUVQG_00375, partial [Thermogutta sp.]
DSDNKLSQRETSGKPTHSVKGRLNDRNPYFLRRLKVKVCEIQDVFPCSSEAEGLKSPRSGRNADPPVGLMRVI